MIGKRVCHPKLGPGTVIKLLNNRVYIKFNNGIIGFPLSNPVISKMLGISPDKNRKSKHQLENKVTHSKIQCLWGSDSEFSREVIAYYILNDHPEYKDCIEQKVNEWFIDFEGSTYQGDCMTSASKIQFWFNSYFKDRGCDEEHISPYIKDFLLCFKDGSNVQYGSFMKNILQQWVICDDDLFDLDPSMDIDYSFNIDYTFYSLFYNSSEIRSYSYRAMTLFISEENNFNFDYSNAIEIISKFDDEFDWISKYEFNPSWKCAFCIAVYAVYAYNKLLVKSNSEQVNKYNQRAEEFIHKYLSLNEQDLI